MTEPLFSVNFSARKLGTTGAIALGDALVYDSTAGAWVTATATARAAADARASAIALTPEGASIIGSVSYQASGPLAREVSGLSATTPGLYQLVRVSTAGRLERIASYTTGDDVVGYAAPDGRVALHIGLPWEFILGLAGSITGRKVVYGDGALAGMSHVYASDDGYLEHYGLSESGPADIGTDRFTSGSSTYARGADAASNRCVWSIFAGATTAENILIVGSDGDGANQFETVLVSGRTSVGFETGTDTEAVFDSESSAFGAVPSTKYASGARGAHAGPNFMFWGDAHELLDDHIGVRDPWQGNIGVAFIGDQRSDAGAVNPLRGFWLRSNASTHHPEVKLPAGGWIDLLSASTTGTFATITADTPADYSVASVGVLSSQSSGGTVTIREFEPPSAGVAKSLVVTNDNADSATLVLKHDNGFTASKGFQFAGAADLVISSGESYLVFYDHNAIRWRATKGA